MACSASSLSPAQTFITPSCFNSALLAVWPRRLLLDVQVVCVCGGRGGRVVAVYPFSVPLASTVPGGINHSRPRPSRGSNGEVWPWRFAERQWRWAERTASACPSSPDGWNQTRQDNRRERGGDVQWDMELVHHHARHICIRMCATVGMNVNDVAKAGPQVSTRLDWTQSLMFRKGKIMSPWDKISAPKLTGKCFCLFIYLFISLNVRKWLIWISPIKCKTSQAALLWCDFIDQIGNTLCCKRPTIII